MIEYSNVVFFDMDYTILENDCDVLWKYFLVDQGITPQEHKERALYYLELHQNGKLPIEEFIQFQMKEFTGKTPIKMRELSDQHFELYVQKYIYQLAKNEIEKINQSGAATVLLTGTNEVIAAPVAEKVGFTDLIATKLEIKDGAYTGNVDGDLLIRESKLKLAIEYCREKGSDISDAAFYADSINDVFLLKQVGQAIVVNPNDQLLEIAQKNNWKTVYWSL